MTLKGGHARRARWSSTMDSGYSGNDGYRSVQLRGTAGRISAVRLYGKGFPGRLRQEDDKCPKTAALSEGRRLALSRIGHLYTEPQARFLRLTESDHSHARNVKDAREMFMLHGETAQALLLLITA